MSTDLSRVALGRYGEQAAVDHLLRAGWRVLERNWRGRDGEVDVLALEPPAVDGPRPAPTRPGPGRRPTLVVVEVKTRRGTGWGGPMAAITPEKLARLRRLAAQWLAEHPHPVCDVRIDVIGVLAGSGAPRIDHRRAVHR